VADVNDQGGAETVELVTKAGGTAEYLHTDVSDGPEVARLVERAVAAHGDLHCAVNAAAIENETAFTADCDEETFDFIIAVNLRSVFLCLKYEIGAMKAAGHGGSIVNIASTNSFKPQPGQPAYTASKHGVLGLTRSAALEYGRDGIRVNAICPGAIDTPMLRTAIERRGGNAQDTANRLSLLSRFGEPNEIAQAALWLCSDASSFTTGHALSVDGGYLSR
jgi:glucose 1-dehydrogenase